MSEFLSIVLFCLGDCNHNDDERHLGEIKKMPIEQYPNIAPPSVSISASLPGASAETLENSVTQVIEQSLTGIDNMRYFSASSDLMAM